MPHQDEMTAVTGSAIPTGAATTAETAPYRPLVAGMMTVTTEGSAESRIPAPAGPIRAHLPVPCLLTLAAKNQVKRSEDSLLHTTDMTDVLRGDLRPHTSLKKRGKNAGLRQSTSRIVL